MYERQKKYERRKSKEAADIGEIPAVKDPERRQSCRLDLFRFLTTYFPNSTGLSPFSDDHLRVIERIQRCILDGGLFVNAVYRGFAKTTITENAILWSCLHAHRKFVAIFGSGADAADGNIDSIKLELAENDLLYEDFPEVCHPIRALEGKPQRCASQTHASKTCDVCQGSGKALKESDGVGSPREVTCEMCEGRGRIGQLTHIEWTADTIVLPHIADSLASGNIITAKGITAASRGMKHKRPDGTQQRPDLILMDDIQTEESASTALQVNKRLGIIQKSILKLGGHNRRIAAVMNATVIQPGDLVEQLLDQKKHPAWQGERIKMVRKFADTHESFWMGEYATTRNTYDPDRLGSQQEAHEAATELYRSRRAEADAGCEVSWEHCYDHETEISAIQHAYNCLIDDGPDVFASECQNEPRVRTTAGAPHLTAAMIGSKVNGLAVREIPREAQKLTAFIDVHDALLYYVVCAWTTDDFAGFVVDYGTWPEQKLPYFHLREATRTLAKVHPGTDKEGAITAGLQNLTTELLSRHWMREDGAEFGVERCLVDTGYVPDAVYKAIRSGSHAAALMGSQGVGVTASGRTMAEHKKQPGEIVGQNWIVPKPIGREQRRVRYDSNYWKTWIYDRLFLPMGNKGALSLFGTNAQDHRLLAEHILAEEGTPTEGRGRKLIEWRQRVGRPDNHLFDCLVGCAVAASMVGCGREAERPKKTVRLSAMQRA